MSNLKRAFCKVALAASFTVSLLGGGAAMAQYPATTDNNKKTELEYALALCSIVAVGSGAAAGILLDKSLKEKAARLATLKI